MSSELTCPDCGQEDPNEFGICRARRTGRNLYCKACCRARVYSSRPRAEAAMRAMKAARYRVERKRVTISRPDPVTPIGKVQKAIYNGHESWEAIRKNAKVTEDQLSHALAILVFDIKSVKTQRVGNEPRFVMREEAAA